LGDRESPPDAIAITVASVRGKFAFGDLNRNFELPERLLRAREVLAEMLRITAGHRRITATSFDSYALSIIGSRRNQLPDTTDDVRFERFVPELAADVLNESGRPPEFDALVIDEAQDLLRGRAVKLLDRLVLGGLASGRWRVFLDPNQNVFGQVWPDALERLEEGQPVRFRLTRNCRNTIQVVQYAAILSGATGMAESQTSGPEVVVSDRWDMPWIDRVLEVVDDIASGGIAASDTAVLVPTQKDLDLVRAAGNGRFGDRPTPGTIRLSTIAGFKGLEATAVVLAGLRSLDQPRDRQAAYIGATRAKVILHLVLPDVAMQSYLRRCRDHAAEIAAQMKVAVQDTGELAQQP
jgi:superfamily I DNA/RNA helicase